MGELVPIAQALDGLSMDEAVDLVEARIVELGGARVPIGEFHPDIPTETNRAAGIYSRTVHLPPGALVTGKRHLRSHLLCIVRGACYVFDGHGEWQHLAAPFQAHVPAGARRLVATRDGCTWTTYHHVSDHLATDAEIEASLIDEGAAQ